MTDIAKLIEELRWQKRGVVPMTMEKAADALERLTTPDEIAGLIGQLEGGHLDDLHTRLRNKAAAVLRTLALENERLKGELNQPYSPMAYISSLEERIHELEASLNDEFEAHHWTRTHAKGIEARTLKAEAERDRYRTKYLELKGIE
jgi:hypothetical protein